ncbi:MAG: helix-turn-helix domain-containing protein [Leptolyngbyaceae bacterium]|nr:helix-turn-helix domain-containing protein [Leptolyngbyaceae bacterium]
MTYSITSECIQCDSCLSQCPVKAIKIVDEQYWIDPTLCNGCEGYSDTPLCLNICPVDSPVPFQAKKGRYKKQDRPALSPELFLNGKNNSFASAIVIWELCNLLAQRRSLPWQSDADGILFYERHVKRGQGVLKFWIADNHEQESDVLPLKYAEAETAIARLDIRAACLHLLYSAYATGVDKPWEEEFVISDRQIEQYLGMDKRKDLSKLEKLSLIRELALQPCSIFTSIEWPRQGRIPEFSMMCDRIWHMVAIHHHFEDDELGCKHLVGLTFRVRAGQWAQHFLNQQEHWNRAAYYQYGHLPRCLLPEVMSHWQQHEGAIRMLLWLLFKTKMGHDQPIMTQTLMRIAYGEERIAQAYTSSVLQKRLLKTFEHDLEALYYYGVKPVFDPESYPVEIQPLWAKLAELPDDAEDALNFWTEDGSQQQRLTDSAPRGKWKRVMNGRFLQFELPDTWDVKRSASSKNKKQSGNRRKVGKTNLNTQSDFSKDVITSARKKLKLSQRLLAEKIGKSQSWIRDIENGRFQPSTADQKILYEVLKIN